MCKIMHTYESLNSYVTLTSPSQFLKQAVVKILNDVVPHIAWQKRKRLYEKDPRVAEGHLPGNSFLLALGRWKSSCFIKMWQEVLFLNEPLVEPIGKVIVSLQGHIFDGEDPVMYMCDCWLPVSKDPGLNVYRLSFGISYSCIYYPLEAFWFAL